MPVYSQKALTRTSSPLLTTAQRTHRHRVDLLQERGPARDATTQKYQSVTPRSERSKMNILPAEMTRRWPAGILRPRVQVYRNDGGSSKETASTMIYSLQQLLDFACKNITMHYSSRRLFNMDGEEITRLEQIEPPMTEVVVSSGEEFRPRTHANASGSVADGEGTPRVKTPITVRPSPRKWQPYTVGASLNPTPSDKKLLDLLPGVDSPKEWGNPRDTSIPMEYARRRPRVFMYRNDGGHAVDCVATLVYTFPALLEEATQTLGFPRAARRIFTVDGQELNSVDDLQYEMKLVVSCGEEYRPRDAKAKRDGRGSTPSNSKSATPRE